MILKVLWAIVLAVAAFFIVRKVHYDGFSNGTLALVAVCWLFVLLAVTAVYIDSDNPRDIRARNIAGSILIVIALAVLALYAYGNGVGVDLPFTVKRT